MHREIHPRRPLVLMLATIAVALAAGLAVVKIRALGSSADLPAPSLSLAGPGYLAQEDQDTDNNEVSPAQVEQYVKVYKAMQHNRSVTVDQATAAQHMTVAQFRDIEARIERDGVLRERVRRELLKMAQEKSNALKLTPQSAPSSSGQ